MSDNKIRDTAGSYQIPQLYMCVMIQRDMSHERLFHRHRQQLSLANQQAKETQIIKEEVIREGARHLSRAMARALTIDRFWAMVGLATDDMPLHELQIS